MPAERLRIDIGSAYPLEEELSDEVRGVDAISGLPRKATITSEEVREALGGPLVQIVDAIKATLDDCTTDLAADLVDNGLVLAGGGALLRGLDRFLTEQTGLPTRVCAEPLTAVARGTHICLEQLRTLARRHAVERRRRLNPPGDFMARPDRYFDWRKWPAAWLPIRPSTPAGGSAGCSRCSSWRCA